VNFRGDCVSEIEVDVLDFHGCWLGFGPKSGNVIKIAKNAVPECTFLRQVRPNVSKSSTISTYRQLQNFLRFFVPTLKALFLSNGGKIMKIPFKVGT